MRNRFLLLSLIILIQQGCIKDPPLNPEADIETFDIPASLTTGQTFIDQANRRILLYLTPEAHASGIAPVLTLSQNATVVPASGDSIHFTGSPIKYSVTSESGVNTKVYDIVVVSVGSWIYNFETWSENPADKYEYPVEPGNTILWSSGNPGVALAGIDKNPESYPTHSTTDGLGGTKAAELVTVKGTPLSELVGVRLFAGSLFLGIFNSLAAMTDPLSATEFGQPYVGKPQSFSGYYKYIPGANFQDAAGNIISGQQDNCALYAVFFKGPERLTGKNIMTSDKIIAIAMLPDGSGQPNFSKFDIPFTYLNPADTSSQTMLAIIASSSREGDLYKGAIGSKLVLDSLRIIPK